MKPRKPRRLIEAASEAEQEGMKAPDFLVRLVGNARAKSLCRDKRARPRRD